MSINTKGTLKKLSSQLADGVEYSLPVGDDRVGLNAFIGKPIKLTHTGNIFCSSCGKKTKKSYSQSTVLFACESLQAAICAS